MNHSMEAGTMSVHQMRNLLGIKKTESYWLVKKHVFETILLNGKMRVVKTSFEEWYANQDHYRKVTGEEPGRKLHQSVYTVGDIADMIGVNRSSVLLLMKKESFPYTLDEHNRHTFRIDKEFFDNWLGNQNHYRSSTQREWDKALEEKTMTIPEMGRVIGLSRNTANNLAKRLKDVLEIIVIGDVKRVTLDSFEKWYQSQTKYTKCPVAPIPVQRKKLSLAKKKSSYSLQEAAQLLRMSEKELYRLAELEKIYSHRVGKQLRFDGEDLQNWLDENKEVL